MTAIEWTDKTWNPVTGCKAVSPGCAHCYAKTIANRFWGDRKFEDVQFHPDRLEAPLKVRKPTRWFVNSMSDLFHEAVTDEQIDQVFAVMALTPHHTYQVLTKRPERMLEYFQRQFLLKYWAANANWMRWDSRKRENKTHLNSPSYTLPLPNVWLGVSVENQKAADDRIPLLLKTPAAVRFLSCEPLLEAIDINQNYFDGYFWGDLLHWVIAGAESGHGARPMDEAWVRVLRDHCLAANVAFFYKQKAVNGKKQPLPSLDGKQWAQFPVQSLEVAS